VQLDPARQLVIVSARYEPLRRPVPWKTRFVTAQLRQRVQKRGEGARLYIRREFNKYFGDPCPGEPKQLVVVFRVRDKEHEVRWVEGALVNVDVDTFSSKALAAKVASPRDPLTPRATPATDNFPHEALPVIMSFLPVYPDRVICQLVCKEWAHSLAENGLTEEFKIGAPDIPGPCYLGQPPSFVEMIVSKSRSSLKILNLDGYRVFTDASASKIFRMAERLSRLDLTDCIQLQDESVLLLGSCCPNLIALTLKRCSKLTDVSLVPVVSGCLKLERLDLSELRNVTDDTLEAIGHNLVNLRALFLRENHRVTDRGISTLCSTVERRAGFEKKKKSNAPLNLRKLHELSLWGLHRLTAHSLTGFPIPALRSLSLEGCAGLDDRAIDQVCSSSSSKTLLSLNVKYCHKLSDRAIETVSTQLVNLQHLSLCYLFRVTDAGLRSLSMHLWSLRSLDVSHCLKITSNGIGEIVQNLHALSELRLCSCKQFDDGTVQLVTSILESHRGERELALSLLDVRDTSIRNIPETLAVLQRLDEKFFETSNGCFVRW